MTFEDFVNGVALFCKSNRAGRLRVCFRMCDRSGSGRVSWEDLKDFIIIFDRMCNGVRENGEAETELFCDIAFEKSISNNTGNGNRNGSSGSVSGSGSGSGGPRQGELDYEAFCAVCVLHPLLTFFFHLDEVASEVPLKTYTPPPLL